MISFKNFLKESEEHTSNWMSSEDIAKHVPKTAQKQIAAHKHHQNLQNHDALHGGSGLKYRHKTNKWGHKSIQVASVKPDKDGFTHHATFELHKNSILKDGVRREKSKIMPNGTQLTIPFHHNPADYTHEK